VEKSAERRDEKIKRRERKMLTGTVSAAVCSSAISGVLDGAWGKEWTELPHLKKEKRRKRNRKRVRKIHNGTEMSERIMGERGDSMADIATKIIDGLKWDFLFLCSSDSNYSFPCRQNPSRAQKIKKEIQHFQWHGGKGVERRFVSLLVF